MFFFTRGKLLSNVSCTDETVRVETVSVIAFLVLRSTNVPDRVRTILEYTSMYYIYCTDTRKYETPRHTTCITKSLRNTVFVEDCFEEWHIKS